MQERGNNTESIGISEETQNQSGEEKSQVGGDNLRDLEKQSIAENEEGGNLVRKGLEETEGSAESSTGSKPDDTQALPEDVPNVEEHEADSKDFRKENSDDKNGDSTSFDENVGDEKKEAEEFKAGTEDLSLQHEEKPWINEDSSPKNEDNHIVVVDGEDSVSKETPDVEQRTEEKNVWSDENKEKVEENEGSSVKEDESEAEKPVVVLEGKEEMETEKSRAVSVEIPVPESETGNPPAVSEAKEEVRNTRSESEPENPQEEEVKEEELNESGDEKPVVVVATLEAKEEVPESGEAEEAGKPLVISEVTEIADTKAEIADTKTEIADTKAEKPIPVSETKAPADEFQNATNEIESQLEEMNRGGLDQTDNNNAMQEDLRDPSNDDYDIMQELADLPSKLHETAGRVADHLRPDVLKWTGTSKEYFDIANQQITESFSPLIGRQMAPFLATMISFAILLLPLIVVVYLFEHIKALVSLEKLLFFANAYLASYFATLWISSFIIGIEPMYFFYKNTLASSYISLQLLQALAYGIYLCFVVVNMIYSFALGQLTVRSIAIVQWTLAMSVGLHYYVTVFHPAIASKPPHTSSKAYAAYGFVFLTLCLFARLRFVKKPYIVSSANGGIGNKNS